MIEILRFAFESFEHFIGTLVLIASVAAALSLVIRSFKE